MKKGRGAWDDATVAYKLLDKYLPEATNHIRNAVTKAASNILVSDGSGRTRKRGCKRRGCGNGLGNGLGSGLGNGLGNGLGKRGLGRKVRKGKGLMDALLSIVL